MKKNIYILPTDKPSRLGLHQDNKLYLHDKFLTSNYIYFTPQHIYITNDGEIKDMDWVYDIIDNILDVANERTNYYKHTFRKIILTTDQDLIKDGIQPINDDFLNWFVKNPNCESVDVESITTIPALQLGSPNGHLMYKIFLPKEAKELDVEDAARTKFDLFQKENPNVPKKDIQPFKLGFVKGAIWQKEKSYGEKDIIDLIQFLSMNQSFNDYSSVSKETAKSFLEQFKKIK